MSDLFENWDDAECIAAWNKLRKLYSSTELLYVLYGGILQEDIKFGGFMCGIKTHFAEPGILEFDFKEASEVEESIICYEPRVTYTELAAIVESQKRASQHPNDYKDNFESGTEPLDPLKYAHMRIWLSAEE